MIEIPDEPTPTPSQVSHSRIEKRNPEDHRGAGMGAPRDKWPRMSVVLVTRLADRMELRVIEIEINVNGLEGSKQCNFPFIEGLVKSFVKTGIEPIVTSILREGEYSNPVAEIAQKLDMYRGVATVRLSVSSKDDPVAKYLADS